MQHLNEQFLIELFKGCITSKSFMEIIHKHLKFHYIPEQSYKEIFEKISLDFELDGSLPTIGLLSQHFNKNEDVKKILVKIKNASITDQKDALLKTFEAFLINAMFVDLYVRIGELHNEGKQDKAIVLLAKQSEIIANFSIKKSSYSKVFAQYDVRVTERQLALKGNATADKVGFGIHALDFFSRGGMTKGTSTLLLGRSGAGKSTIKRWVGLCAARLGARVVHFQAEGTEQECLEAYDAGWTGINLSDIEFGTIPENKIESIKKTQRDIMAAGGEIIVKASEQFDSFTIEDCRDILEDIIKTHGPVDLGIFDYLEIFTTKGKYFNSETGERKRREDIANKITNMAITYKMAALTSTQANDISPKLYNNPDYVMTRSDISEFKGALKPFSIFITINQTDDEYENGVARLWIDKFRKYKKPNKPIRIAQSLDNSRFYDSRRSLQLFWDEKESKMKGVVETKKK